MIRTKKGILFWCLTYAPLFVSLASASVARAGSVAQTLNTGGLQASFSATLNFNAFDPSLGTLTSVTISGTTTSQANLKIFNESGEAQTFAASVDFPVAISTPGGSQTSVFHADAAVVGGTVGPEVAVTNFPGVQTTQAFTPINVPSAFFGNYTGAPGATAGINFAASTRTFNATGDILVGGSLNASASITVDYEYTPPSVVPGPASAVPIVGLTILGLWLTVGRRSPVDWP